ncbi:hypothetical protein [Glycomyces sp. NPDC048151]|uniref:hypothetical protein n=1 Tax=Glycomyces sp. NPDC048151 TaxID=3364002 RepID=UPI00371FFD05
MTTPGEPMSLDELGLKLGIAPSALLRELEAARAAGEQTPEGDTDTDVTSWFAPDKFETWWKTWKRARNIEGAATFDNPTPAENEIGMAVGRWLVDQIRNGVLDRDMVDRRVRGSTGQTAELFRWLSNRNRLHHGRRLDLPHRVTLAAETLGRHDTHSEALADAIGRAYIRSGVWKREGAQD